MKVVIEMMKRKVDEIGGGGSGGSRVARRQISPATKCNLGRRAERQGKASKQASSGLAGGARSQCIRSTSCPLNASILITAN